MKYYLGRISIVYIRLYMYVNSFTLHHQKTTYISVDFLWQNLPIYFQIFKSI